MNVRAKLARLVRERIVFVLVIILTVTLTIVAWRGAQAYVADGQPPGVRLHVVPNSDNAADQQLKLAVRDALRPVAERMMAADQWSPYFDELLKTAEEELLRRGATYPVRIDTETGEEDELIAIRVVIGRGRGANWFCVLVPPLCFADLEPIEKVAPASDPALEAEPGSGGIRIGWKWLGKWFGQSSVPLKGVGNVDKDDVHTDFAHTAPRDGDVGLATE